MKFGVFDKFGAKNSVPVFAAFHQGLCRLGLAGSSHDMEADVAVIWSTVWAGRMRSNHAVWQQFRRSGRPVIVLEVGMIKRGRTWKVGINGTGPNAYPTQDLDHARARKLSVGMDPWRNTGSDVLICLQRNDSEQWYGQPRADIWLTQTVEAIRRVTDRPITVRQHPRQRVSIPCGCGEHSPIKIPGTYDDFDFAAAVASAWAVVNHNSGPGSQAIMMGVPAFVHPSSLAAPVANLDIAKIENPERPDRTEWLVKLCHSEWTTAEIAAGYPISRLLLPLQSC